MHDNVDQIDWFMKNASASIHLCKKYQMSILKTVTDARLLSVIAIIT